MLPTITNLLQELPGELQTELTDILVENRNIRIERIVSSGQVTAPGHWYDQTEHEWVLVIQGRGILEFEDGRRSVLNPGDHLLIPAHCRHRVTETSQKPPTIWLAVFYSE